MVVAAMLAEAEEKSDSVDWLAGGAGAAHTDKSLTKTLHSPHDAPHPPGVSVMPVLK